MPQPPRPYVHQIASGLEAIAAEEAWHVDGTSLMIVKVNGEWHTTQAAEIAALGNGKLDGNAEAGLQQQWLNSQGRKTIDPRLFDANSELYTADTINNVSLTSEGQAIAEACGLSVATDSTGYAYVRGLEAHLR